MRAELAFGGKSIVFVWKLVSITDDQVRVFSYQGMAKCSDETHTKRFARGYWGQLVRYGYKRVAGYQGRDES